MPKYLRYMGEFLSRAGVVWRVEILQEADSPFDRIGSLTFEADEALVIEWGDAGKETTICGSTATLRIESPGDRTYEDLYTIAPGRIRMDVYREDILYWSGALDPEFYEEPYERASNYPVALTFSDFGVLDRLKYDLGGMRTLREIVDYCIGRTVINTVVDESLISTRLTPEGGNMSLSDLKVRSDNFYDEDGEALSLKEVLEGILQPLALRMIQRAGRVYIYDMNSLYLSASVADVEWNGDSQTMGTDRVYNNAKITWSTYAQGSALSDSDCWVIDTDANKIALNEPFGIQVGAATVFSYHYGTSADEWRDATGAGFSLWISEKGKNAELGFTSQARFFKTVPQFDGEESEGIAICWPGISADPKHLIGDISTLYLRVIHNGYPYSWLQGIPAQIGETIFRSNNMTLPPVDRPENLILRIGLDMLLDPRFNPYEPGINWDIPKVPAKDWQGEWAQYGNFVYVPVMIFFRPDGSNELYCWNNRDIILRDIHTQCVSSLGETYGEWVKYAPGAKTWGYFSYYNPDDRSNAAGVGGWQTNRPAINPHVGPLTSHLRKAKAGQYIPYPNLGNGGTLWIEVRGNGWIFNRGGIQLGDVLQNMTTNTLWEKFNWILCKLPEVEIMNNRDFDKGINTDDVEYRAEINAEAKENIEIDTICGSSAEGVPTARGAYFSNIDGHQITELSRAGRTSQIEDLLIGTLFSQFGQRRTRLSGEMTIASDGLCTYAEVNQEGKKFMITSDTQDVIIDTSDAIITELRPDEYMKREG